MKNRMRIILTALAMAALWMLIFGLLYLKNRH